MMIVCQFARASRQNPLHPTFRKYKQRITMEWFLLPSIETIGPPMRILNKSYIQFILTGTLAFSTQISLAGPPTCLALFEQHNSGVQGFFFDQAKPLAMTMIGDLKQLVDEGKNDYRIKGKESTYSQPLTLIVASGSTAETTFSVDASLRGQTSVDAMPFPKLKVKGKGLPTLKLITHGWETDGKDLVGNGMLASPKAVYREASVYELLESLNFPLAKSQRALITYKDTSTNYVTTQPALILETTGDAAKRLGGDEVDPLQITKAQKKKLASSTWATLSALTEVMIGNWDFDLPYGKDALAGIHNISAITLKSGEILPLMEDFNMSSAVTGFVTANPHIQADFHPDKPPLFRSMLFNLLLAKSQLTVSNFKQAVAFFASKKEVLLKAVEKADVDSDGRENIRAHVITFFEILTPPYQNETLPK